MSWIWNGMMAFALLMLIALLATFLALDASRQVAKQQPKVYEVMAMRMKGDSVTIEPGWTPFGVDSATNVVYVIREKVEVD